VPIHSLGKRTETVRTPIHQRDVGKWQRSGPGWWSYGDILMGHTPHARGLPT